MVDEEVDEEVEEGVAAYNGMDIIKLLVNHLMHSP